MYDVAESRLCSVTKRLLKENIYEVYDDILRQWQKESIIEAILKTEVLKPGHYLPNRPECLSVGPSLSGRIPPLLLRFRTGAIGVIADIKQAFLQLAVKPEDRDYLRFLWWNTENKSKLKFFRHCRVVFGVTSSPFLLNASIRHHLNSAEFQLESFQQTIEKLKKGFYVDNLTIRVGNQEESVKFKTQTMEIMTAATFELRCWAHTGVQDQESQNVLGLLNGIQKLTSFIAIYLTCYTFTKLLLQEAWRNKLDWDEDLSFDLQLRYQRWAKHLNLIKKCRIPRRMLHGTLRCVEKDEVKVSLVSAKARFAPVQRPTIPQLELLGATIGARIASTILETLNSTLKTYFWTDSMTVLGWIINSEPLEYICGK
ncbi:uncharacterized protein TNCV_2092781 [Trichonephila clavipes]|nr:uncharacterized protein TNCV_2092781 [Trichonephila clavipes]